jgi:uncharacterized phage protein gp47/JayE
MPVERLTASQWEQLLKSSVRDQSIDLITEISDFAIVPQARGLERIHLDLRKLSFLVSRQYTTEFEGEFEVDLEAQSLNEGARRKVGSQATTIAVFHRTSPPTSDVIVRRGYPIGTYPNESTGQTLVFIASETVTMQAAEAASYFNVEDQDYQLQVPIICAVVGTLGLVGANRITRPLRPLVGFSSVTNPAAPTGGRDRETSQELIDRTNLAVMGRDLSTLPGLERFVRDEFPVDDVLVVGGTDDLLERAGEDAGAVDLFVLGDEIVEVTESITYLGPGQLLRPAFLPLVGVSSVQDLVNATTFVEGTDYEVAVDATGYEGSEREQAGIRFTFTGTAPDVGTPVTIMYTYDNLVRRVQASLDEPENQISERDLLSRRAQYLDVIHTAQLTVLSNFVPSKIKAAVIAAVEDYVASLGLGDALEESDIQGVVRRISGVDRYKTTRLTLSTTPTGIEDITPPRNRRLRLATLTIT